MCNYREEALTLEMFHTLYGLASLSGLAIRPNPLYVCNASYSKSFTIQDRRNKSSVTVVINGAEGGMKVGVSLDPKTLRVAGRPHPTISLRDLEPSSKQIPQKTLRFMRTVLSYGSLDVRVDEWLPQASRWLRRKYRSEGGPFGNWVMARYRDTLLREVSLRAHPVPIYRSLGKVEPPGDIDRIPIPPVGGPEDVQVHVEPDDALLEVPDPHPELILSKKEWRFWSVFYFVVVVLNPDDKSRRVTLDAHLSITIPSGHIKANVCIGGAYLDELTYPIYVIETDLGPARESDIPELVLSGIQYALSPLMPKNG